MIASAYQFYDDEKAQVATYHTSSLRRIARGTVRLSQRAILLGILLWCGWRYLSASESRSSKSDSQRFLSIHDAILHDPSLTKETAFSIVTRTAKEANRNFSRILVGQSSSVDEAGSKYRKRNGQRKPPKHLAHWYEFALEHDSALLDEFQEVERDVGGLRRTSAQVLKERTLHLLASDASNFLGSIRIVNGSFQILNSPSISESILYRTLSPLNGTRGLPEMILPINWHDNPKTLFSVNEEEATRSGSSSKEVQWNALEGDTLWEQLMKSCSPTDIEDVSPNNICRYKATSGDPIRQQHGLFRMPWAYIKTAVPLLGWIRLPTQTDILIPQVAYSNPMYYNKNNDVYAKRPFAEREASIFWRGSATGSQTTSYEDFRMSHRPRLVRFSSQAGKAISQAQAGRSIDVTKMDLISGLPPVSRQSLFALERDTFNMSMTHYLTCSQGDPKASPFCPELLQELPLASRTSQDEIYNHRYVVDTDGNGMSGRFYGLLQSGSLVFKQTVYREWHQDRLFPWVHFVPLSVGLEELPVLLDFFENTQEGQQVAAQIAANGASWSAKALRPIDFTIYLYRLFVELADVLHPQ